MLNLFQDTPTPHDFDWIVATFSGCGATEVIKQANEIPLRTYYPLRMNIQGNLTPLWLNYLFIEFRPYITIPLCRSTFKFINVISTHDEEGFLHPVLVPKNAINENLNLVSSGIFDNKTHLRRFYGKGSLVKVIEGIFMNRKVRLECDLEPNVPGYKEIPVSIGGWNGKIEVSKLAL